MEIDEQDISSGGNDGATHYLLSFVIETCFSSTVVAFILVVMSATGIWILIHKYLSSEELIFL